MATLVPCLDALRSEFNRNFPRRDKASDGWIGDTAHQANPSSDHNPDERGIVHAIDVDEDLRAPGASLRECVEEVVRRHRSGADNRLTYVIYERTIWSASNDWRPRDYSGSNPHDKHAHFSASYVRARENSRASFGVEDIVKQEDINEINNHTTAQATRIIAEVNQVDEEVWAKQLLNPFNGQMQDAGTLLRYIGSRQGHLDTQAMLDAAKAAREAYEVASAATNQNVILRLTQVEDLLRGLLALHPPASR